MVKPKLSVVTLGVEDLARSQEFYAAIGWPCDPAEPGSDVRFIRLEGVVLALYGWDDLAEDAGLPTVPSSGGFRGMTLAHNEPSAEAVDAAFDRFVAAGAKVVKRPVSTAWGGYSGYVADPDGHLWEIAHNPFDDWT
jgi:catechol 2,3-dioxygenase-like lactoylglutathione lyase family enzyme